MPTQTAMSEERVKRIVISIDAEGKPQVAKEHETVELNRKKNEEVLWVCTEPFRIDFKDVSPFYEDQFNDVFPVSGLARRSVLGSKDRIYKYTIDVKGKKLDPGIKVYP